MTSSCRPPDFRKMTGSRLRKLDRSEVLRIRELAKEGKSPREIADLMGGKVARSTISGIVNGRSYSDI